MSDIRNLYIKFHKKYLTRAGREKNRILKMPRFTNGTAMIAGKQFLFHDNMSFLDSYKEIFENGIYEFNSHPDKKTILDCGANMGLSVLYFSLHHPQHRIIAFEPDETIYRVLEQNIRTFGLTNVKLMKNAVWDKEADLEFFTDNGMGGRVGNSYANQEPQKVRSVRLKDYITDDIAFLKIDIEGAEHSVLVDCKHDLAKVDKLFFEYHGSETGVQTLHELLGILKDNNFHYYIKESSTRMKPFTDKGLICDMFDMAINIFGYHPAHS